MIFELFAFGTIGFWVAALIFFALAITFEENDSSFFTLLDIVAMVLFFKYVAKIAIFTFLFHNPLILILSIIAYILVGTGWSLVKWKEFIENTINENRDRTKDYIAKLIDPSRHKKDLLFWLSYWPLSMTWLLIHKPIKILYNFIYARLSKAYQRISDSALAKIA